MPLSMPSCVHCSSIIQQHQAQRFSEQLAALQGNSRPASSEAVQQTTSSANPSTSATAALAEQATASLQLAGAVSVAARSDSLATQLQQRVPAALLPGRSPLAAQPDSLQDGGSQQPPMQQGAAQAASQPALSAVAEPGLTAQLSPRSRLAAVLAHQVGYTSYPMFTTCKP